MNNYDPIAPYYDFLSRLFFGRSEIHAQADLLPYIKPGGGILIVGGGTGWILEEIAKRQPAGLRIVFVEPSGKMMALARRRSCGGNEVRFVCLPVEEYETAERFDCILTGFVFDNFSCERAGQVIGRLHPMLERGGYWLFADFQQPKKGGKFWQGLMLRTMYLSARLVCQVEANELPDVDPIFAGLGYQAVFTAFYYGRFIKSIVYQKVVGCAQLSHQR